jgi:hypothetical protein
MENIFTIPENLFLKYRKIRKLEKKSNKIGIQLLKLKSLKKNYQPLKI